MWIEIMFFIAEWRWNFTSLIYFFLIKHLLSIMVIDNVSCFGVNKVASFIGFLTVFIYEISLSILFLFICENVTLFISFKVTNNVTFVESSAFHRGWNLNNSLLLLLLKVSESVFFDLHSREVALVVQIVSCFRTFLRRMMLNNLILESFLLLLLFFESLFFL